MRSIVSSVCLFLAATASASIYDADIWLYRMTFDSCGGTGVEEWLASSPVEPMPLTSEEAIKSMRIDGIPVPLPSDRPNDPATWPAWQFTPGAAAFPGRSILLASEREGVMTFLDMTPIQYLTQLDGDRYETVTLDGSPGTRVFVRVNDGDGDTPRVQLRCEYSLIGERESMPGVEGFPVGRPQWDSGRLSTELPVKTHEWMGALIPIGSAPVRTVLMPLVRLKPVQSEENAEETPTYFEYDINGDGVKEQVPFYARPEGAPLARMPRNVAPEPPVPDTPVPREGYSMRELGQYAVECKVIRFQGILDGLPFAPCEAAWPVLGNAVAVTWPEDADLTTLDQGRVLPDGAVVPAHAELISAPRVTSLYMVNASTNTALPMFKVVVKNNEPPHAGGRSYGGEGFGGGGVSAGVPAFASGDDIVGALARSYPDLPLGGQSVIADIAHGGLRLPYDVHGWGPFRRSKELVRDSGVLASMWVGATRDPDVMRVDLYFISPYIVAHDTPPATEAEAEALMRAHEFRYLYECRDGQPVCFISSAAADDHSLVFVTADRVPWEPQPLPPTPARELNSPSSGDKPGPDETVEKAPSTVLKNVEVHGEIRVRASTRSR